MDSNWQIEHACPQCGAPVILDETDRLLTCEHCRVKLYLASDQYLGYLLPPADDLPAPICFAPYWRFKGMAFTCQGTQVDHKVVDASLLAVTLRGLPLSLGFRPQALRLRFVLPQTPGGFLKPGISLQQVSHIVRESITVSEPVTTTPPHFFHAFLGETVSLIYAPFFLQGPTLYDAVLQRPVCSLDESGLETLQAASSPPENHLRFVATLCPHCGWDLRGEKDTLVLVCTNCDSAWHLAGSALERIPFGIFPGGAADSVYLPFWRIRAPLDELPLHSYADLMRLANVPRAIRKEWEEIPFHFWSPAFKIRPRAFLQAARTMTLAPPQPMGEAHLPKGDLYPVTFSARQALESLKVILAHIAMAKQHLFPRLSQLAFGPTEVLLCLVPFAVHANELIQESLQFRIDRSTVLLGRKL